MDPNHEKDTKAESQSVATVRGPDSSDEIELPGGWLYRRPRLFGRWTLPHFASPIVQLCYVAFVFFLCPGMYNALSGLGGGGQVDATVADNATVALYSAFAIVAFFSGTVCNKLGVRITLGLGCFGYSLYIASFLSYNHNQNAVFVIVAGAILGVSAALLWAAESVIMISYPHESKKGKSIAIFWMIFNFGAVIGSIVPLAENVHSNESGSVGDSTYIAFLVLTAIGMALALAICNADKIVRHDGSKVIIIKHPTWKSELLGLWEVLKSDYYIVALFPMFLASNWFYTYQFNDFNLARFNLRTRSLNSLLYWFSQILGAWVWGTLMDMTFLSRRTRARAGLVGLFAITMGLWGGGYSFQTTYDRASAAVPSSKLDWTSDNYGGLCVLYIFYGIFDSVWQTYTYWILGAISNNSRKLAILAGFYKALQSAGAVIVYRMDAELVSYMGMLASTWGLCAGSLVFAAPVVWLKITNHSELKKDLEFSDEVEADLHVKNEV